jgi:hypothetical protein
MADTVPWPACFKATQDIAEKSFCPGLATVPTSGTAPPMLM